MSTEYPSFITPVLGLTILTAPCLWYFEWATWSWIVAGVLYGLICYGWLYEAFDIYRAKQSRAIPAPTLQSQNDSDDLSVAEKDHKWTEDDFVRATISQRGVDILWKGNKEIEFIYRNLGRGSFLTFKVTATEMIAPDFAEDEDTYFKGSTAIGEQRYFCLRYIKGKKVTDVVSGEVGTLRKLLGVKRRVYE